MEQAIAHSPADLAIMTKSVPHDWQPFYPPNPLLGAVGGREQWMELDFGHEYEGQHLYPYAEVEANLSRLRHGHRCGVRTFIARLDRAVEFRGVSALHCPWGRVELLTLQRFAENPAVSADEIWAEWERGQFPGARRAVEAATLAVQSLLFPQNFWYADHSRLPTWDYAASHLVDGNADRLPTWTRRAEDFERDRQFREMPAAWLGTLLAEAQRGRALARESAEIIRAAALPPGDRAAWLGAAESLEAWMELFALHRAVFFPLEFARHHPNQASHSDIEGAIEALGRACAKWAPRLAEQRLENEGATAHFPRAVASLRAALADVASRQPVSP